MYAAIYTRNARPNAGLFQAQCADCKRLAAESGFEVVGEFHDDGHPGSGLDQLLALARGGNVSAVVVRDVNRFGRAFDAFGRVMTTLDEVGVLLYIVGEGRLTDTQRSVLGLMRVLTDCGTEQPRRGLRP
ncbi:recombinase family protein [Bifidobacterium subtile]|uniref:Resolvase/invertase-type recombinase catalytic domain-containing protein n=2 Tax=Actinomycetes TaxID=1760 RepID=A0A087DTV2_9BIFI|nr:hypothetical protein BISU_2153 [Bifidobacterium subtile]QOL37015.1 recombinase family protein [Bifidobacterium subtile]SER69476.1 Resolvase, N terminal domain [Propionibacterium cyclohexanicum]